jgi:hypothetical protein
MESAKTNVDGRERRKYIRIPLLLEILLSEPGESGWRLPFVLNQQDYLRLQQFCHISVPG